LKTFFLFRLRIFKEIIAVSKKISLPGFDGISIYNVASFFLKEVFQGDIQIRARAIAFSFFLALFPTVIFLFTLIPYLPIEGFQEKLLSGLQSAFPYNTYEAAKSTIEEIVTNQNGGLLSFGFLFAMLVSTNGVNAIISSFDKTISASHKRSGFRKRLVSIYITLLLSILTVLAIVLIIVTEVALHYISNKIISLDASAVYLLLSGKYLILVILCFTAISSLYYFGPSGGRTKFRFISAGSTLATILVILTSIGFNFFIQHFGQFNKVYGSIGTLIVILIYINFNCLQLLIGYELNNAIDKAKIKPVQV
jgi:membrane protein